MSKVGQPKIKTSSSKKVISKIKSPFVPQNNPIAFNDTIQVAFEKTQGQINELSKPEVYISTWDAANNIPTLPAIPTNSLYKSGEYYKVIAEGTFNNVLYTVGDCITVSTDKTTGTLFWERLNFDQENKQNKIFTYTIADFSTLNAITGMVAGNTAKTLDTLKEYIYTTQWEEVFETLANKNKANGYSGLDADVSILASQLEKPILNFLPRIFYGFYIDNNVATFDNGANIINKNQLLLCTKSGTVGLLNYTKGSLYQINQNTSTPSNTMLAEFLTISQCVGKLIVLDRAFNDNIGLVYDRSVYKTNLLQNDWEILSSSSATNLSIINKTSITLDIASDTGADATVPQATTTEAGLLSAADKVKINNAPYVVTTVANQADMLALTNAEIGKSVVYVTADKILYQLTGLPSSNIANWSAIASYVNVGNDGTNNTVPSSAQMQTYVTQALLNTPSLPFVNFATTTNDILSGLSARDGYTPVVGNFALVKNQTNNDNSVYRVTSGSWIRQYYNTTTQAWNDIVAQTTYSQLNINGGIINVLNGTVNKNLQYQFNIVNPSAIFGSSIVSVTATTKLPQRDIFQGYVDITVGNNTNNNGTASFPYATVSQDLISASFPHITYIAPSGLSYSEAMSITSGQSNFSLIANDTLDAGKTQFSNPVTLQTGNTRYKEKGITRSTGASVPIVFAAGNLGRHSFENCTWTTSGTSLMSINPNVTNWVNLYNIDAGGSPLASIPLPNFTTGFVFNIYNQTKYLPFSFVAGSTGANCTINVYNSLKGAVVVPDGFTGTINYFDGYSVNEIITGQTRLNTILADTTLTGFYAVSFASPTGMPAGCIFNKISASGFTVNNITETFANGKTSSIYDLNTKKTFFKDGSGAFNGWSAAGSGGGITNNIFTATNTTNQTLATGFTGGVIPITNTNSITITPTVGAYIYGANPQTWTNLSAFPCYVAGIPIGPNESISLIPNSTAQWESVDKKYEILTIPTHSFTNALHQNKVIATTGNGASSWSLADGADLDKLLNIKFLLNVIDTNRVLVANSGNTITCFVNHNLAKATSYSCGNATNGGLGSLVDGSSLTLGYRAQSGLLTYRNDFQIDWNPTNDYALVITSIPVALQKEAYNKQFALIDGVKSNVISLGLSTGVNNIISLAQTFIANDSLKISATNQSVYGKFSGETQTIFNTDITLHGSQIPVFNASNPNLSLAINMNTVGAQNYILAVNSLKTNGHGIFAIPAPVATPNLNFIDAVTDISVLTAGKLGYQLNPLKGYKHNGTAIELYDFIVIGKVNLSGSTAFNNLINYTFNRTQTFTQSVSTASGIININNTIGTSSKITKCTFDNITGSAGGGLINGTSGYELSYGQGNTSIGYSSALTITNSIISLRCGVNGLWHGEQTNCFFTGATVTIQIEGSY